MTTFQVHLLMLAMGVAAYFFLAGEFGNRKSLSRRLRRQWWMGVVAAFAVALSPMVKLWLHPINSMELLSQSLLASAISLLVLLLFALLRKPFKSLFRAIFRSGSNSDTEQASHLQTDATSNANVHALSSPDAQSLTDTSTDAQPLLSPHAEAQTNTPTGSLDSSVDTTSKLSLATEPVKNTSNESTPIIINADSNETLTMKNATSDIADELEMDNVQEVSELDINELSLDASDTSNAAENIEALEIDESVELSKQLDNSTVSTSTPADIESVVQMAANPAENIQISDAFSHTNAANDTGISASESLKYDLQKADQNNISLEEIEDEFDLTETEELFAEIRQDRPKVELPDEDEYRLATERQLNNEIDLDTSLVNDISHSNSVISDSKPLPMNDAEKDLIEEAEVVEIDESVLDFGNDHTGQYAHPSMTVTQDKSKDKLERANVPATLDAAIVAAKITAATLQSQVSSLENSITELDDIRDSTIDATIDAAAINAEYQDSLLKQKDDLLRSENEARIAAESVIKAQNDLIDRAKRQESLINAMLDEERGRLKQMQSEVERTKKMARTAAILARRAAIAQQESKDAASREYQARLKSEESARKAVDIARNAINALAAEEAKNGKKRLQES